MLTRVYLVYFGQNASTKACYMLARVSNHIEKYGPIKTLSAKLQAHEIVLRTDIGLPNRDLLLACFVCYDKTCVRMLVLSSLVIGKNHCVYQPAICC